MIILVTPKDRLIYGIATELNELAGKDYSFENIHQQLTFLAQFLEAAKYWKLTPEEIYDDKLGWFKKLIFRKHTKILDLLQIYGMLEIRELLS